MDESTIADHAAKSLRIFLVENHRDTREFVQMYLEMLGHTVESAGSMDEALATLPTANCDVLLSDIGLPDGDGWELLRQVQDRLSRPVFAIAMSGFGMGADQLKSKDAGYRHHLLKPIVPEQLQTILEEATGKMHLDH